MKITKTEADKPSKIIWEDFVRLREDGSPIDDSIQVVISMGPGMIDMLQKLTIDTDGLIERDHPPRARLWRSIAHHCRELLPRQGHPPMFRGGCYEKRKHAGVSRGV